MRRVIIKAIIFCLPFVLASVIAAPLPSKNTQVFDNQNVNPYKFKVVSHDSLDLIGGIWAMAQDDRGFMWFGGENGLARFDGYKVTIFRNETSNLNSLSSSYVRDLFVDSHGILWVGTSFGLNQYRPETDDFQRFFHDPTNGVTDGGIGVHSIAEDKDGALWLGTSNTGLIRFNHGTNSNLHLSHANDNPNSLVDNEIYTIFIDSENCVWVGTNNNGLDRLCISSDLNAKTAKFTHFTHSPERDQSLSNNSVLSVYQDHQKNIWIGTGKGLNRFDSIKQNFRHYFFGVDSPKKFIQTIGEDSDNNLWVTNSGDGISIYQSATDTFTPYQHEPGDSSSLANNNVRAFYLDRDNNFWLGHFASGVSMIDRYARAYTNYRHNPYNENSLDFQEIVAVAETDQGNLWVGTSRGLNYLNRTSGLVTRYTHDPKNSESIADTGVLGLLVDTKERLWVGQWGGGLNRLDPVTLKFKHYKTVAGDNTSIPSDYIWALLQDSTGRIWVGSHDNGLSYYDESLDKFSRVPLSNVDGESLNCNSVFALFEDSGGDLWVGCSNGLHLRRKNSVIFEQFRHVDDDNTSLSANHIIAINEDSHGRLWVATQGGGVNVWDKATRQFKAYRIKNGLSDNAVSGILEDGEGFLWFSTGNGLSRFNPTTETFKNYGENYGVAGCVFNRAAFLKTRNGELVFGSSGGLNIISPDLLYENKTPPQVNITGFQLFNKDVKIGEHNSPLTHSIFETEQLTLEYENSSFSFEFAALSYQIPSENTYAYYLDGFDKNWNSIGVRRQAFYTNLNPGHYVFRVKAANNEGVWGDEATIHVTILPPWWRTWWVYLVYAISLIIFMFLIAQVFWQRKLAENERRISSQLRSMDKLKDSFLANTSHELRTPLSGMIGLSESLKEGVAGDLPASAYHYLEMIIVSGKRLSNLINDILDFSKLKESQISLKKTAVDLHSVTEVVVSLFVPLLKNRPIVLKNELDEDLPLVMADENRLQQILYNFIGNAVKFTEEGSITISAEFDDSVLTVFVNDTGIGISEDNYGRVFKSYEQIENSSSHGDLGTGLGLAVTKQLVELHGGSIGVKSCPRQGSSFFFTLPLPLKGDLPLARSKITFPVNHMVANGVASLASFKANRSVAQDSDVQSVSLNAFHILVVDDEPVNRLVLDGFLKLKHYRVTECVNGQEALEFLSGTHDIDLVLLDVMMPRLSGLETCKKIRERYSQTELPVIFLTGRDQRTDLSAGYGVGGNDFLTKPVSKDELLSRVETHLKLADKMRHVR